MGKNNTSTNIPPLHIRDNKFASWNQEKADALNNFFISVSDIEEANIPLHVPNFNSRTESVLSQIQVSESKVKDILSTLKVNKATGPDGMSNRMLKHTSKSMAKPLSKLSNLSLEQRIYIQICGKLLLSCHFSKREKNQTLVNIDQFH